MSDKAIKSPATYRKLSEPFPDVTAVNEAAQRFFDELYALREKHHIRDVHVVLSGSYLSSDEEIEYAMNMHIGDSTKAEMLVAWAMGRVQGDRQELVERLRIQSVLLRKENR